MEGASIRYTSSDTPSFRASNNNRLSGNGGNSSYLYLFIKSRNDYTNRFIKDHYTYNSIGKHFRGLMNRYNQLSLENTLLA